MNKLIIQIKELHLQYEGIFGRKREDYILEGGEKKRQNTHLCMEYSIMPMPECAWICEKILARQRLKSDILIVLERRY